MQIKFWGVRGSVPAPLTPFQVEAKIHEAVRLAKADLPIPFEVGSTYGGNTTCIEVVAGGHLFILDMGTGVRELGKVQLVKALRTKQLSGTILQSHVHWDHIQGVPFWAPLYLPRRTFNCGFDFYGGKQWDSQLDAVYRGQMSPPVFPVNLHELETTATTLRFSSIWDGWQGEFGISPTGGAHVLARKLFHPQETFGYRIKAHRLSNFRELSGDVIHTLAFTTDHEPYATEAIPASLIELVQGVDVWITDCQYSHADYTGEEGPQKMGWGHSFPEYIARVARVAKPKRIITTHHDPDASDTKISALATLVQSLSGVPTQAAFEGMAL